MIFSELIFFSHLHSPLISSLEIESNSSSEENFELNFIFFLLFFFYFFSIGHFILFDLIAKRSFSRIDPPFPSFLSAILFKWLMSLLPRPRRERERKKNRFFFFWLKKAKKNDNIFVSIKIEMFDFIWIFFSSLCFWIETNSNL